MQLASRKYRIGIAVAVAVVVTASLIAIITILAARGEGPPLNGWMTKFTVAKTPSKAPLVMIFDRKGSPLGIEDFKGKLLLVNFWATWCAPCIREMPSLLRLAKKLAGTDFALVAVSTDRGGWQRIDPFLEKHGLGELTVYHDPSSVTARTFKVQGLPTTILIDRQGREIGRLRGIAEWDGPDAIALMRHYLGS